jgi:hypothetical protein
MHHEKKGKKQQKQTNKQTNKQTKNLNFQELPLRENSQQKIKKII